MMNIPSIIWFMPRNIKNNLLFYSGNILVYSLLYLMLSAYYVQIFSLDKKWAPIFLVIAAIAIIYNLIYYLKQSKRLGLLSLYGINKLGLFFIVFFENFFVMFFAFLVNIIISARIQWKSLLVIFIFMIICSGISVSKYLFFDIYNMIKD